MAYRMTEIDDGVFVGRMSNGYLDIEVWDQPKPPHATQSDYDDHCTQIVLPPSTADALFDYLR